MDIRDLAPLIALARTQEVLVVVLGDPAQSLMMFRGALGDIVGFFEAEGIRVERLALTYNFRSTHELIDAVNAWQVAAGWSGPLARPGPNAPHGALPLMICTKNEAQAIDVLVETLAATRHADAGPLVARRLGARAVSAIAQVCSEVKRGVGPARAPLVEIVHRTVVRGDLLQGALEERTIAHARVRAAANPYDTYLAECIEDWFATDRVPERIRNLIVAHANRSLSGARHHEREEIRACSDTLLGALGRIGTGAGREAASLCLLEAVARARAHRAVRDPGWAYLASAEQLVRGYRAALATPGIDRAIRPFVNALRVLPRPAGRRVTGRRDHHRLVEEAVGAGVPPTRAAAWLQGRAAQWRNRGLITSPASVLVKTDHGAKGDSCDLVVGFGAEQFPLRQQGSAAPGRAFDLEAL